MTRVTKRPEVRREELLDTAFALCGEVGYQAMSVESVTQAAGVAKGTFYHYFASKDELLFAMLRRLGDDVAAHLGEQSEHLSGDAIAKLAALMRGSLDYKLARATIFLPTAMLYRPENFGLRQRIYQVWAEATRDGLRTVVAQGVAEGSFHCGDLETTLDILLSLWFHSSEPALFRALAEPDAASFARMILDSAGAMWAAQERLLGVPAGSFAVTYPPAIIDLLAPIYTDLKEVVT